MPREICHLCRTPAPTMLRSDTVLSYAARTAWILLRPLGRLTCPACAPRAIRALPRFEREIQAEMLRAAEDKARYTRTPQPTLHAAIAACEERTPT